MTDGKTLVGGGAIRRAAESVGRTTWIVVIVTLVLAICYVSFGGLRPAAVDPAELGVEDEARTSLYSVTVLKAETTDAVEDEYLEAEPGETLLLVTMRLTNLSDRPIGLDALARSDHVDARLLSDIEPLIALTDVTPSDTARAWRTDDSAGRVILQPDVPGVVQVAWPISDDAVADGLVRLDIYEPRVSSGVLISAEAWKRDGIAARISAPVESAS